MPQNVKPDALALVGPFFINLFGFVLMTPAGIYYALSFDFGAVHGSSWLLLLFYALAASVWTVWLWMTGLKTIPAAKPRMPGKAFFTPYRSAFVKVITTPGPGLATITADIMT
jgi:hypothetical protein